MCFINPLSCSKIIVIIIFYINVELEKKQLSYFCTTRIFISKIREN